MLLAQLSDQFKLIDWLIVFGYLGFTTWFGTRQSGKQSSIRDFFLGGRRLPWYAVCGSIIATEISAVTFVGAPSIVFAAGGNFSYLQTGLIGSLIARIIVGYVLVPAYYQREIYSPYDYMGAQLGGPTRGVATALFTLGGLLGQSARVYLTALVLSVIMDGQLGWMSAHLGGSPLVWAIVLISIVAIGWTFVGGMTTVIWTDALLFLLFLIGAVVALLTAVSQIDGGWQTVFDVGWSTRHTDAWYDWGKFTFFDFSTSTRSILTKPYTIWAAVIAISLGNVGPYGTDQLIVQRMFCCRGEKPARWAIIGSTASQVVTLLVMMVGAALYAYNRQHPLAGEALKLYTDDPDRIFPIFIVQVVPVGLKGLLMAAIFAAAISSLTSILAALSQTTMFAFYLPLRARLVGRVQVQPDQTDGTRDETTLAATDSAGMVSVSRMFVVGWGIVLAAAAVLVGWMDEVFPALLDLALALAAFTSGALLAGFFLAFLRLRINGDGYLWSAPLSVMVIFAVVFHDPWSSYVCLAMGIITVVAWLIWGWCLRPTTTARPVVPIAVQFLLVLAGAAMVMVINLYGYQRGVAEDGSATIYKLAWPWYAPLGAIITFVWGYLLAGRPAAQRE